MAQVGTRIFVHSVVQTCHKHVTSKWFFGNFVCKTRFCATCHVCVCVCVCVCVYKHACVQTCAQMCANKCIPKRASRTVLYFACKRVCACVHTRANLCANVCRFVSQLSCKCVHVYQGRVWCPPPPLSSVRVGSLSSSKPVHKRVACGNLQVSALTQKYRQHVCRHVCVHICATF